MFELYPEPGWADSLETIELAKYVFFTFFFPHLSCSLFALP